MEAQFPLSAFTAKTAAALTGLSVRQLHTWDREGFFRPTVAADGRRPHSRIYAFEDLVALRVVAALRRQGASMDQLRRVRRVFAEATNQDWATRRFYLVGRNVYFSHDDAVVAARPLGQAVEPTVLDLAPIRDEVRRDVERLRERKPEEIGQIERDRSIMNNAWVVAGTRIPTATVDWFHRNGYDPDSIVKEFPRLTPADVEAAVAFEHRRRETAPAALRASA